jgi:hypothetical protein
VYYVPSKWQVSSLAPISDFRIAVPENAKKQMVTLLIYISNRGSEYVEHYKQDPIHPQVVVHRCGASITFTFLLPYSGLCIICMK